MTNKDNRQNSDNSYTDAEVVEIVSRDYEHLRGFLRDAHRDYESFADGDRGKIGFAKGIEHALYLVRHFELSFSPAQAGCECEVGPAAAQYNDGSWGCDECGTVLVGPEDGE